MLYIPPREKLQYPPQRLVWHWTAGRHTASEFEKNHYHILVENRADSSRIVGGVPIERNMVQKLSGPTALDSPHSGYAAHCGGLNTRSIGVSLCGMAGAKDYRPSGAVSVGSSPITLIQVRSLLSITVSLVLAYGLEVTERTVLSHHEVRKVYGVGRAKWDISWLPGFNLKADEVGDFLRSQVRMWIKGEKIDERLYVPPVGAYPGEALEGDDQL